MKTNPQNTRLMIAAICAAIFICTNTAMAATFTVNQAGDAGSGTCGATCTLRDAVIAANNAATDDTINFAAGLTTITLVNTEITIANNGTLTINGFGANVFTIDGGAGTNRIFFIDQNAVVTITDATLTGGKDVGNDGGTGLPTSGGAIFVSRATLTLNRVHVTGNSTQGLGNNSRGGGVIYYSSSNNVISNSTFSNNINNSNGGGGNSFGRRTSNHFIRTRNFKSYCFSNRRKRKGADNHD